MKNTLWILLILMIVSVITWFLFPSLWSGIILVILAIILISGIVNIENRPPQIGLVTRLNKKIWRRDKKAKILEEGLNWIIFRGIIFDILYISTERRQINLDPQQILTPDNVNIKIPISIAWNIDEEECHHYINIKEDDGVNKHISDILEGRLREYSRHPEEGPMGWREMIASGLKTLDYLVKSLCQSQENPPQNDGYDYLNKIDDNIPTPILLDWHRKKDPPNHIVRKQWGDGEEKDKDDAKAFEDRWKKLEEKFKELAVKEEKSVEDFKKELIKKIEKRIALLEKLQRGNAKIKIINSGSYLNRLTVGDVNPSGDIYLADIALQKEEKERKSETYEVETDLAKAIVLKKAIKKMHKTDANIIECFNAIMKWKMIGNGKGFVYDGQLGTFAGLGDLISSIMKGGKK